MKRYAVWSSLALIVALAAPALRADVKTRSKTTIKFEGMMGRIMSMAVDNDVEQTVSVRGSRMATRDGDNGQIVDLTEEKVYTLDYDDRRYTVKTFAEMRAELEELKKRMQESAAAQQPQQDPAQEQPPSLELEFDVAVDETGETRRIADLDTRQVILTITARQKDQTLEQGGGFVMTNDLWLAPEQPGAQEIVDFTMKYAQAVYGEALGIDPRQAASISAMLPALGDLSSKMVEESKKLQGTPIRTVTVFETVRSEEQMKAAQAQQPSGGGGFGGMLARRLGGNRNATPRSTVMTTTHELQSISTTVTDADVTIPEGFRER